MNPIHNWRSRSNRCEQEGMVEARMQGGTIDRAYERNGNKGGRNLELEKKKERKKNEKTRN